MMADIVRDWRTELVEAYPDLFHPPVGDPGAAQGSPECGEGWCDLLERAFARIRTAVQADGGSLKVAQIKEKYGTLRLYWQGSLSPEARAQVAEAVDLAEARSACTCELCGENGRLYGPDWLTTRCMTHARGRPVERPPGFENIHLMQRIVDGRLRTVACRRYDRASDRFIDVDPASLGIEEE